jgi:hypothetical protein
LIDGPNQLATGLAFRQLVIETAPKPCFPIEDALLRYFLAPNPSARAAAAVRIIARIARNRNRRILDGMSPTLWKKLEAVIRDAGAIAVARRMSAEEAVRFIGQTVSDSRDPDVWAALQWLLNNQQTNCAAAAATDSTIRIAARDNQGQSGQMDPAFKRKLQRAVDAALTVAQEDGLGFEESVERVACYLLNHRDPEIRAFQQRSEEYAQRRENQAREAAQRRENQTRKDLN